MKNKRLVLLLGIAALFLVVALVMAQPQVSVNDTPAEFVAPGETYIAYNITFVENVTDSAFTNLSWFNISGWNMTFTNNASIDDIGNISLWNVTSGDYDYIAHNASFTDFPINISLSNYNVSNGTTAIINVNITLNITGLIDGKNVSFNATLRSWENSSVAGEREWVHINYTSDTAPETINVLNATAGTSNTSARGGAIFVLVGNVTVEPGDKTHAVNLTAITFNATANTTLNASEILHFALWNDTNASTTLDVGDELLKNMSATDINATFTDLNSSMCLALQPQPHHL